MRTVSRRLNIHFLITGRGTSTYDGTAIAHAVCEHLCGVTRCRALFATHYHTLVDEWAFDPRVALGHMDCYVEQSNNSQGKPEFTGTLLCKCLHFS
jgi:DNA mismatch repair protein MSH6